MYIHYLSSTILAATLQSLYVSFRLRIQAVPMKLPMMSADNRYDTRKTNMHHRAIQK